ncbi:MAG: hypothetical protein ABIA77_02360 [Candidatus Omnitrophota bacterium]
MLVYFDRYDYVAGYGKPGESADQLLRRCENLSDEASLSYAFGSVADMAEGFDANEHNEMVALKYAK